jgi:hypothetical protein
MTTYTNPFTGQTINPSSVSYESLAISANTLLDWPINGTTGIPTANIIDVTASTTGLYLILPPATQVSTGQTVLVRNIGSNPFTVTSYAATGVGTTIVSVASGVAQYIFLTNNSATAGVWASVVLGAGTSSANASALAGYGLLAIGTTLNQAYAVNTYYSSATLTSDLRAQLIVWSSGAGALTLPSSAAVGANWFCMVRNSGTGVLTLTPAGSDTIDGNANQQLQLTESLVIVSNGAGWNTFGYGRSNTFAYTALSLSITGGTTTLTSAQAANTIQVYGGTLTSNAVIIVPPTVQLYAITNNTSGAYTFTVKTASGTGVAIPQGTSLTVTCDGTNVYNASSGTSSSITSTTFAAGSAASPSINFTGSTTSGFYLPSSNTVGIAISGAQAATFSATGLYVANGISGGLF